ATISRIPPGDPGGTPGSVGRPDPTTAIMQIPSAIMEWRPAPGIIRSPIPAAIGIHPATAIAIGTPGAVDHTRARLPAPAKARQLYPGPVRSKVVVEITDVLGGIGISRFGHFGWGCERCGHWLRIDGRSWTCRGPLRAQRRIMGQHRAEHRLG